jgi:hypothetical protein
LLFYGLYLLNIQDYIVYASSGNFSQLPDFDPNMGQAPNLPNGSNDYKLSINYILNTDTDNLARFFQNHVGQLIRTTGIRTNYSAAIENNTEYYSKVYIHICDKGYISLNTHMKITQDIIESIKALKVNIPRY